MKNKRNALVVSVEQLASDVFSIWIKDEEITDNGKPGQFVSIYCRNQIRLLPRPISICEINREEGLVRFVYRVVGKGTEELSKLKVSDSIQILGPLGNGYRLKGKNVLIVGGGIGIPPLLELTKRLDAEKSIILGYRDELFLNKDFEHYGKVYISTENGSVGTKGNVIDAIIANNLLDNSKVDSDSGSNIDMIFACGPVPMLRGLKEFANKNNIKLQVSLEERMACGVGVCLSCVCKTKEKDSYTNVHNTRICCEGPVFDANEVDF